MKKSLIIPLAFILCFTFASCSFKSDKTTDLPETTTEEVSEKQTDISEPPVTSSNTAAPNVTSASKALPENKADIVELFNTCLKNTSTLKRTSYQRTLLYCNATMMSRNVDICEYFPDIKNAAGTNDTSTAKNDLVALSDAQVKSAVLLDKNDKTATYKINLKDVNTDQTIQSGQGGYWGVLEFKEISELIVSSTAQVGVNGVEVGNKMNINLTEGVLQVVIDIDSKKIISVEGTYKEGGTGEIKYSIVSTNVDLQVEQKMSYSAK